MSALVPQPRGIRFSTPSMKLHLKKLSFFNRVKMAFYVLFGRPFAISHMHVDFKPSLEEVDESLTTLVSYRRDLTLLSAFTPEDVRRLQDLLGGVH